MTATGPTTSSSTPAPTGPAPTAGRSPPAPVPDVVAPDDTRASADAPSVGRPRIPVLVSNLSALVPDGATPTSSAEALALAQQLPFESELAGLPKRPDPDTSSRLVEAAKVLVPRTDGSPPRFFSRGTSEDLPALDSSSSVGTLALFEQEARTHRILAEHFGDANLPERALETTDTLQMALHWTQVLARAVELLATGLQSALAAPPPVDNSAELAELRAQHAHAASEVEQAREDLAKVTEHRDALRHTVLSLLNRSETAERVAGDMRRYLEAAVGPPLVAAHFLSSVYPPSTCSLPALYALFQACTGSGDATVKDRVVLVAMAAHGAVLPEVPELPSWPGPDGSETGPSDLPELLPASHAGPSPSGSVAEPASGSEGGASGTVLDLLHAGSPAGDTGESGPAVASLLHLSTRGVAEDLPDDDLAPEFGGDDDEEATKTDTDETMAAEPVLAGSGRPPVEADTSVVPGGELIVDTDMPVPAPVVVSGPAAELSSRPTVRGAPEGGHTTDRPSPKRSRPAPPPPRASDGAAYTAPTMPALGPGVGAMTVDAELSDTQTTLDRYKALRMCDAYRAVLVVARNLLSRGGSAFRLATTNLSFDRGVVMGVNPHLPYLGESDWRKPVWRQVWRDLRIEFHAEVVPAKMQVDKPNSGGYPNYIVWRKHSMPVFVTYGGTVGYDHYRALLHQCPWDDMWARRVTRFYLIDPSLLDAACEQWLVDYFRFMYANRQAFWEVYHWVHSPHVTEVGHSGWRQLLSQREALVKHLRVMASRVANMRPSTWPRGYESLIEAEPALWFIPKLHCTWVPVMSDDTPPAHEDRYVLARQLEQLHREEPIRIQYGGCPQRMVESFGLLAQQVFYLHHYAQVSWLVPKPFDDPSHAPVPLSTQLVCTPGPNFYEPDTPGTDLDAAWKKQCADTKLLANIDAPNTVSKMLESLVDVWDRLQGAVGAKEGEVVDHEVEEKPLPPPSTGDP